MLAMNNSSPVQNVPLVKSNSLLGALKDLREDPLLAFLTWQNELPGICKLRMGHTYAFYVSSPKYIRHILTTNSSNYRKSKIYDKIRPLLGDGIIVTHGNTWRRQRRLCQPAMSSTRLSEFCDVMTKEIAVFMKEWEQKCKGENRVDLTFEMSRLTLRIIMKTMFSDDLDEHYEELFPAMQLINQVEGERFWNLTPVTEWIPTPKNIRFEKAIKVWKRALATVIERRRSSPPREKQDLLDMLIRAHDDETGTKLSFEELKDNAMTFLVAGHETTSVALTWTWYFLSKFSAIQDELALDCKTVLNGSAAMQTYFENLKKARCVLQESMRLRPPAWGISREAIEDDHIDGITIPKDTLVFISQYAMHRNEECWHDPESFKPERFLEDDPNRRNYYLPFGAGERICIGNHFALAEAQLILSSLVQNFKVTVENIEEIKPLAAVTLIPSKPVFATIQSRGSSL